MSVRTIRVASRQGAYDVRVGADALESIGAHARGRRAVIVSTSRVWRRYARVVHPRLPGAPVILLPDGERAKTLATVAGLYRAFVRHRVDRRTLVVAVGGGVTGDTAGFAAATFVRGLDVIQVPTTLMAQVDSAIGGKVGVNLPDGKNLVGAFHAPRLVVCDPRFLGTLSRREFRSGWYEVVKYGAIRSRALLGWLERRGAPAPDRPGRSLTRILAACARIKARIVSADEHEHGARRALNFGHTIGHALEAVTAYRRFRHGEAVAWGMRAAAGVSAARGLLAPADHARLMRLVALGGRLPRVADLSRREILRAIGGDKKVVAGRLHLVLLAGLGRTVTVTDVTRGELDRALVAIGITRR